MGHHSNSQSKRRQAHARSARHDAKKLPVALAATFGGHRVASHLKPGHKTRNGHVGKDGSLMARA